MSEKKKVILIQIIIMLFLYLFFTQIVPVVPFDGDDWYFTGSMRKPIPLWGAFNPSKVLPEVIQPLGGYIAAYLLTPIINDYVRSITLAEAFLIVSFMMLYFVFFYKYLKKRYFTSTTNALISEIFLCLTFFCVFKKYDDKSYFGFWASDLTCYFHYIVPGLLNMTMLFIMDQSTDFKVVYKKWTCNEKSLFWVGVYFAVFSSIQLNIILAGYCSWIIVRDFALLIIKKNSFKEFIQSKVIHLFIIIMWFISLIYDANGMRAQMLQKSTDSVSFFSQPLSDVFLQSKALFSNFNVILLLFLLIMLTFIFVSIKQHRINISEINAIAGYVYLILITFIYLMLIYAKTGGIYSSRPDAMWAIISYYLVFLSICFNIFINAFRKFNVSILLLILTFFFAINQNRAFANGSYGYDYVTYKKIDNYIIKQVIDGDLSGKEVVEVHVPNEHSDSNWPHPYNMSDWLQNTLYAHKVIRRRMKIIVVPDNSVNELFYYDISDMEKFIDLES